MKRAILGWLEDTQIACFNKGTNLEKQIDIKLSALERAGSDTKMLVLKLDQYRVIVVESRHADDLDLLPTSYEGASIYLVDTRKNSDGPIRPILAEKFVIDQSFPNFNGSRVVGTLTTGESVISNGYKISNLLSSAEGDFIEVTVN